MQNMSARGQTILRLANDRGGSGQEKSLNVAAGIAGFDARGCGLLLPLQCLIRPNTNNSAKLRWSVVKAFE
jgi:hypothetical protein